MKTWQEHKLAMKADDRKENVLIFVGCCAVVITFSIAYLLL
jgi:hypothetical protein